jgi:hypothetical protein
MTGDLALLLLPFLKVVASSSTKATDKVICCTECMVRNQG